MRERRWVIFLAIVAATSPLAASGLSAQVLDDRQRIAEARSRERRVEERRVEAERVGIRSRQATGARQGGRGEIRQGGAVAQPIARLGTRLSTRVDTRLSTRVERVSQAGRGLDTISSREGERYRRR